MPNFFLAKTDPETYSISDLAREKETNWDGVRNYQALIYIKQWEIDDIVFVYHSLGEARIVGLMQVIGEPEKDQNDPRGISWHAKVKYLKEFPESQKISLKEVKDCGLFADFALVRQSRLSTMKCPDEFVLWLENKGVDLSR